MKLFLSVWLTMWVLATLIYWIDPALSGHQLTLVEVLKSQWQALAELSHRVY